MDIYFLTRRILYYFGERYSSTGGEGGGGKGIGSA
jgi:hypothetical protein